MRVAVIGAGASGLCALRHLKYHPYGFHPVGFELSQDVGGTWNYTEDTGTGRRQSTPVSSMYKNLRTNLPKEVMAFPDLPFDPKLPSFVSHTDVAHYLSMYAQHFALNQHIQFNTAVEMVSPVVQSDCTKWKVTFTSLPNKLKQTDEFDAVVVCNGHFTIPLIPDIPGIDSFTGEITHSHNYRVPERYKGKRVIILGAGASGQDIALDVSSAAKQVFLSSRKPPLKCTLPPNVQQVSGISSLKKNSCILENGDQINIDSLLLCTGYRYHFPFLDPNIGLTVDEDERVTPLYKHIFHAELPSLCFIGLCKAVCPFPHFDIQAQTVVSALSDISKLPSRTAMKQDESDDLDARLARGLPRRYAHFMGPFHWKYTEQLVKLGQFPDPIPQGVKDLWDYIHKTRTSNLMGYKQASHHLDKQSFTAVN